MLTIETIHETVHLTVNALDLTKYVLKTELAEFKTSVELEFDDVRESISLKADKSYVDEEISKIEIPSLDGYATEKYVNDQISKIDFTDYATKDYVQVEISKIEIPSLDGYATEKYVDDKFNSLDLSDYATKEYVKDQIDLIPEVDLEPYATKVYVQDEIGKIEIPSLSGYATELYVDSKIDSIDLSGYATKAELNDYLTIENAESLATKEELKGYATLEDIADFATESYVDGKIDAIDLSGYALKSDLSAEVDTINIELGEKADKADLVGLATEQYVNEKVSSIDLSSYATTQYVNSELNLKADKSQLDGLATEDYVKEQIKDLPQTSVNVVQTTGNSTTDVMSQKAVTDELADKMSIGDFGIGGNRVWNIPENVNECQPGGMYYGPNSVGGAFFIDYKFSDVRAGFRISNAPYSSRFYMAGGSGKNDLTFREKCELYHDKNTYKDKNGYLNTSKNPVPTLTTSDMADTVVNNETMTVTSGAVYRALEKKRDLTDNEFTGVLKINCENDNTGTGIFFFNQDEETFRANIVTNSAGMQFNQRFNDVLTTVLLPKDGASGTMATREWVIDYIQSLEKRIQELENKE